MKPQLLLHSETVRRTVIVFRELAVDQKTGELQRNNMKQQPGS